ncbi:Non-reducing polyketide synthase andM [Fusarium oxysporum f. sp. rapae]|uniref:Non-reducing polyketide synthase andM n=1 Tax=Fusarium oxysporum f. sp. rapae TaxID=485398 RepID=A0A8J5U4D1_FUSOX|nr:Non-reducing polyketide synthase andM [Fusarium oxysporum f. sp. rapae]
MYLELAALAVVSLTTRQDLDVTVKSLTIKAPLGLDTEPSISLAVIKRSDAEWDFELSSTRKGGKPTLHAVGSVALRSRNVHDHDYNDNRWAKITQLLDQESEADALRGAMVYELFSTMTSYSAGYRGLGYLAGKGGEAAGVIMMPKCTLDPAARTPNDAIADPFVIDTFLQVPGAFVHSLRDIGENNLEEE